MPRKRGKRDTKDSKMAAGPPAQTGKTLPARPTERLTPEAAFDDHSVSLGGSVYKDQLAGLIQGGEAPWLLGSVFHFLHHVLERLAPRDPLEELLVAQMLWTHVRLAHLSSAAAKQHSLKWAAMMHEAADRAANTFRRQMLALAEYRSPGRGKSFTAIQQANIGQANIAQQQVVQNQPGRAPNLGNREIGNPTNEQGSGHERQQAQGQKALPADGARAPVTEGVGPPRAAVAAQHRAADPRG